MNTPRKFWLVLIGAVLTLAIIACSCNTIIPKLTSTPTPTTPVNPMPELEGYWLDTETNDVHVIAWQNGQYVVTAVNDGEYGQFAVTSQNWDGSALTWTYKVSYNETSVTFTTVSVSGDYLYTSWSNSTGSSGSETLQRVSSPEPPAATSQEAIPGLAGYWLDTETNDVHVIEWQNGQYVVTAVNDDEYGQFTVTSQYWDGSTLTWTYKVSYNDTSVTFTTLSVSGDSLYTTWSNSTGSSGSETLQRVSSSVPPVSASQEAIPGLAGHWLDTETNDVHTIEWMNGQYVVTSVIDDEYGEFAVTSQSWDGSTLTWTYKVSYNDTSVTFTTISVSGDSLYTTWSNSTGSSGTETLQRQG